jgi:hypothetical protein
VPAGPFSVLLSNDSGSSSSDGRSSGISYPSSPAATIALATVASTPPAPAPAPAASAPAPAAAPAPGAQDAPPAEPEGPSRSRATGANAWNLFRRAFKGTPWLRGSDADRKAAYAAFKATGNTLRPEQYARQLQQGPQAPPAAAGMPVVAAGAAPGPAAGGAQPAVQMSDSERHRTFQRMYQGRGFNRAQLTAAYTAFKSHLAATGQLLAPTDHLMSQVTVHQPAVAADARRAITRCGRGCWRSGWRQPSESDRRQGAA